MSLSRCLLLMPVSLRDWLPENHLACFISDVVDHLNPKPSWPAMKRGERLPALSSSDDGIRTVSDFGKDKCQLLRHTPR
jgi:hypothetical protein